MTRGERLFVTSNVIVGCALLGIGTHSWQIGFGAAIVVFNLLSAIER